MSFLCFTKQLKPWKTNNSLNEGEKDDKEGWLYLKLKKLSALLKGNVNYFSKTVNLLLMQ